MMNLIEQVEGEIKVLQKKLELLKSIKEHHSQEIKEAYKVWWGQYPELETDSEYDDMRWQGFQAGYMAALPKAVPPDEVECDEKDNSKFMIMDEVVEWNEDANTPNLQKIMDRIVKKHQAQKLYNRVRDELGYSIDLTDEIVDLVEDWIVDEQSAEGSQNVNTELLVDGFNDCVRKMKGMLR